MFPERILIASTERHERAIQASLKIVCNLAYVLLARGIWGNVFKCLVVEMVEWVICLDSVFFSPNVNLRYWKRLNAAEWEKFPRFQRVQFWKGLEDLDIWLMAYWFCMGFKDRWEGLNGLPFFSARALKTRERSNMLQLVIQVSYIVNSIRFEVPLLGGDWKLIFLNFSQVGLRHNHTGLGWPLLDRVIDAPGSPGCTDLADANSLGLWLTSSKLWYSHQAPSIGDVCL